jgi:hypothetical protein
MIAFHHGEGIVFASKNCRKYLGEWVWVVWSNLNSNENNPICYYLR